MKKEAGYAIESPFDEFTVSTKIVCASRCLSSTSASCAAFEYRSTTKSCKLSSSAPVETNAASDPNVHVYRGN